MAHPVTFKGSRLARWILKAFGWKLAFEGFPTLQGVAIVYPHTSNWDFPVGILAKWALGIPANFWGKDSLFKFPVIGAWMRWVGGVPIDRSSPKGVVGEMVQVFKQHKREGHLLDFYNLTGDVDADYAHMAQVFQGVTGYHAEQASPVLPWSPASKPSLEARSANKTIHS